MANTERTESKQRQLANLKPWKEGESGNPAGRPKGSLGLKSILRRLLDTPLKNEPDPLVPDSSRDMSVGEKAMLNLVVRAVVDGDPKAIKDIVEMLEGKPAQSLSLPGDPDNPVTVDQKLEVVLVHAKGSPDE